MYASHVQLHISTPTQLNNPISPHPPPPPNPPSQFEAYLDVLTKCMCETTSHAERKILMNSAVSGAFRLSHTQRVVREVLEKIDLQMTALERQLAEDRHNLTLRQAFLQSRQAENAQKAADDRAELVQQHMRTMNESKTQLLHLMDFERDVGVQRQHEIAEMQAHMDVLQQDATQKKQSERQALALLTARLDETQKIVAAAANERDEQREISGMLKDEHAAAMHTADEEYADIREEENILKSQL